MNIYRTVLKVFAGMLLTLSVNNSNAQLVVTPHDTTVCGNPVTITATYATGTATALSLGDDSYSGIIPIGFTFNYFGTAYTQCIIGANGVVTFNTGNANGYCTWPIGAPIPSGTMANSVMGPWMDVNPNTGGTISYVTTGVAPNRQFVVTWCDVPYFSCSQLKLSTQIILNEGSDLVEVHLTRRVTGCSWNGDYAIEGVNGNGGNATAVPGRNYPTIWGAVNDAYSFTWNGANYVAAPIPFAPLPINPTVPINWYVGHPSLNNLYASNVNQITVMPLVPTTYYAQIIACGDTAIDSSVITIGMGDSIENFAGTDPTMCGAKNGYITLSSMVPGDTFIVRYQMNGAPQTPIQVVVAMDGTITIPNLDSGTYDDIYITTLIGCESNHVGPVTLVNPPFSVGFDTLVMRGCEVDSVQFIDTSIGVFQYAWDFGDGNSSTIANPLHVYQDQGIYNITLVGTNGFCTDTKSLTVDVIHPIDAGFALSEDSICNGETIFFTDNSITTYDATYAWDFGDGVSANTPNTSHQYTTDGVYNASLTLIDYLGCVSVESHEIVVGSISVEVGPQDTTVCLVDSMLLYSFTTNSPYFSDGIEYSWSPATGLGNPNAPETYFYEETPGDHTFVLTATGLPMNCVAKDTLTVHIEPRPILVNVTPGTTIPYGNSIQLHAEGVMYYVWTPSATLDNPNIGSPVASPTEPTTYMVIGINENGGCRDTAEVVVDIDYGMNEFVPSVFSPNGDGKNDMFRIVNLKFQKLVEFRVFNRWGKEVYSTTDATRGWDGTWNGTPQDPGVFTYIIRVNTPEGNQKVYKGNVTLIR